MFLITKVTRNSIYLAIPIIYHQEKNLAYGRQKKSHRLYESGNQELAPFMECIQSDNHHRHGCKKPND